MLCIIKNMIEPNEKTKLFIEKAIKIHGDKYDYSKVVYTNNSTKIIIICKEHDEFLQQPNNHLMGKNCKKCSMENIKLKLRSNTKEFIKKSITIHGDKYDYLKCEYIDNSTNIIIICKNHGEFLQTPSSHLSGRGCIKCGSIQSSIKQTSNTEEFIEKSTIMHSNKYDYSKVEYIKSLEKIIIICKEHGEFLQTPIGHLSGHGCIKCGTIKTTFAKTLTTNDFIIKSTIIHGNKYDYSKVEYIKRFANVKIICKIHGEFYQKASEHLSGCGCKKCGKVYSPTNIEFIENSIKIHGDKYDYSKVEYIKAILKVIIICKEHGEFLQTPNNHLSGGGCIKCGIENTKIKQTSNTEEFIEKSTKKHGDKYDYSRVEYKNCKEKIIIICKKHGEYLQEPSVHLTGCGCPKCSINNYSKSSIKYLNFMEKMYNIQIQHAENVGEHIIKTTKFSADGYCEETNTIYEFHGDFWHGNPNLYDTNDINKRNGKTFGELYQKTLEREQLIKDLGYKLFVIWEHDWNKLNKSIRTIQQKFKQHH